MWATEKGLCLESRGRVESQTTEALEARLGHDLEGPRPLIVFIHICTCMLSGACVRTQALTQFLRRNRSKKETYKCILQRLVTGCNQPFNYGHWRYCDGHAKVKGFMRAIKTSWETWLPRVLHNLWFIPFLLPLPQSLNSLGQTNSMWGWEEDLVGSRSGRRCTGVDLNKVHCIYV